MKIKYLYDNIFTRWTILTFCEIFANFFCTRDFSSLHKTIYSALNSEDIPRITNLGKYKEKYLLLAHFYSRERSKNYDSTFLTKIQAKFNFLPGNLADACKGTIHKQI